MADSESNFPVLMIEPEWVLEDEPMGSKEKFWFRHEDCGPEWLFKYPQANTGQHWAEKIAAEIAKELDILHARVELALFEGVQGSATESFARDGRELYHGNQVLAGQVLGYDKTKKWHQSSHTLANIFTALDRVFRSTEAATAAKQRICGYLILDALIGNTDRHHENWGILVERTARAMPSIVAPSFDHASSLGRELRDDTQGKCRLRILKEDRLETYAENAPGAIYWDESDGRAPSPLELVRRAAKMYPELFRPHFEQIDKLKEDDLKRAVTRIPADWMSDLARQFAIELMCHNLTKLRRMS